MGHNRVAVGGWVDRFPKVAALRQPWALGRSPVGAESEARVCESKQLGVPGEPRRKRSECLQHKTQRRHKGDLFSSDLSAPFVSLR